MALRQPPTREAAGRSSSSAPVQPPPRAVLSLVVGLLKSKIGRIKKSRVVNVELPNHMAWRGQGETVGMWWARGRAHGSLH